MSYLLFALAHSFGVLLLSRLVAGAMGATVNVAQAYLADVTPTERRAGAMGMLGAAFGLGFVVGPALGGMASHFGNAAPGLVASALTAINLVLAWRWLPESRSHRVAVRAGPPVHWSRFLSAFLAVWFSTVAFTVLYVVFPLQVERTLGFDRHQSAYLFVLLGLVSAGVQGGLIGRLVRRFGEPAMIATGGLLLAAGAGAPARGAGAGRRRGPAARRAGAGGRGLRDDRTQRRGLGEPGGASRGAGPRPGTAAERGRRGPYRGPGRGGRDRAAVSPRAAFLAASGAAGFAGLSTLLQRSRVAA